MRLWIGWSVALVLAIFALVFVKHRLMPKAENTESVVVITPKIEPEPPVAPAPKAPEPRKPLDLDLAHVSLDDSGATVRAKDGSSVALTLNPRLQKTAEVLLSTHHVAEGAIVMLDVASGRALVYASYVAKGPARDLCREASAPAASLFKIVTAAALVENAHLGPNSPKCFAGGGEHGIHAEDLIEDSARDTVCTTLGSALAKSTNTVFARLAKEHLSASHLEEMAHRFGFGKPVPFDVAVEPSTIHVPDGDLELARTAAGFWNTTLSPLEAAWISATIANRGTAIAPSIVESGDDVRLTAHPVAPETADAIRVMMERTITEGTSYKTFHGKAGAPQVVAAGVAGKTGTLSSQSSGRFFTWFSGFAPTHSSSKRPVAIAALVVNGPSWQLKANVVAREMLRAYLEDPEERENPKVASIARRRR